jgi:hypothetical protein
LLVEPFEAFAGWRSAEQAAAILENVQGTSAAVAAIRANDIPAAIRELLSISVPERIGQLASAAEAAGLPVAERGTALFAVALAVAAVATVAAVYFYLRVATLERQVRVLEQHEAVQPK